MSIEHERLNDLAWRQWGPYLSERQWGTVREDYSPDGSYWDYFTFDAARSRAYRWGEDGIAGFSDNQQRICLSVALWNQQDPFLKERYFGLSNSEGNHGEDVKEHYYYLDALPSHAYMKTLYKYPQCAFPYERLRTANGKQGKQQPEFELIDTGCFDDDRYFDVTTEYAKASPTDILMQITVHNCGKHGAPLDILPHVWFRNTWSWGKSEVKPVLSQQADGALKVHHPEMEPYFLYAETPAPVLFTENETNVVRVFEFEETPAYFKDAFHDYVVNKDMSAINPKQVGSKAAIHYSVDVPPNDSIVFRLRLSNRMLDTPFAEFGQIMETRRAETSEFYATLPCAKGLTEDEQRVQRQAFSGMVWNRQYYNYNVWDWLNGDADQPSPPESRMHGRNSRWEHIDNADIISMPDKWEFPWYAAWDLAFHCVAVAGIDPQFAKDQLVLFTRETYMHPNGQLPAYEGEFSHVNPPVHAWATWRVFQMDRERAGGAGDWVFLERVFHKLLVNFTWWVNRLDEHGLNVFQGGFLGLDNIGVIDRDGASDDDFHFAQADATSWMAMYSLNMMRIALELAKNDRAYVDIASKFFQHFLHIAKAMHNIGDMGVSLWDDDDQFYYDVLRVEGNEPLRMKVRSIVGLTPLFAVETLGPDLFEQLPEFEAHMEALFQRRPDLAKMVSHPVESYGTRRHLLALVTHDRIQQVLKRVLDETEFLSPFGVRALSRTHLEVPYCVQYNEETMCVQYEPGESYGTHLGGNSNWRGPVWFPVNYLLIDSLREFCRFYGDAFKVECPTGSKNMMTLNQVADELSRRLTRLFLLDDAGRRPAFGNVDKFQQDPRFRDNVLFYEYFDGDTGRGCGASHQTGWTGLVANLICQLKRSNGASP